jgi:hypothetical protein
MATPSRARWLCAAARWVDESFEIKVRNHKSTPVQVPPDGKKAVTYQVHYSW